MPWGQLVLGPPGSGKTTYCRAAQELLRSMGRPCVIVNLDPANELCGTECGVNVADLITVAEVMDAYGLGPNGGLLYCIEYLVANADWLEARLTPLLEAGVYVLLDCPGQAELFTTHDGLTTLLTRLTKALDLRLVAVNLIDAHHCSDPAKFISGALLALQSMIRLELPHINVLSKADQTQHFEGGAYGIDSFTDMLDLRRIMPFEEEEEEEEEVKEVEGIAGGEGIGSTPLVEGEGIAPVGEEGGGGAVAPLAPVALGEERGEVATEPQPPPAAASARDAAAIRTAVALAEVRPGGGFSLPARGLRAIAPRTAAFLARFRGLNDALVGVLEDFSLVSFVPASASDASTLRHVLAAADKAGGWVMTTAAAATFAAGRGR